MKGVILAGGSGTRLSPFSLITNKHLLPVYDKPVICYAIEKLVSAGIDRIMIITSPHHVNDFIKILGSGESFKSKRNNQQIQIVYGIQNTPSGVADGLYIAKEYVGSDSCVLYLGDNIIEDDLSEHINNFQEGALVFLKEVKDPGRFGVASVNNLGNILKIEEKPEFPETNLAVTGIYVYDNTVFEKMIGQPKSSRGEYEITYINNKYIEEGKLRAQFLKKDWFDVGTIDSLLGASNLMKYKKELMSKVQSLSIFFPCYNDKGTIASLILEAKRVAQTLTDDFEIIVIDDGSTDGSREVLLELKKNTPELLLIFHKKNEGYGGALRSGFKATTKDLVFYTDGDGQYDINELPRLVEKLNDNIDVVNGFKIKREDPIHRIVIGFVYQYIMRLIFWLPIRDPDCDFRLIRRKVLDEIELKSNTGTITIELVKKIQNAGFRFAEIGVSHHFRIYGKSQFFNFRRVFATVWRLIFLWFDLLFMKKIIYHLAQSPVIFMALRNFLEGGFKSQKKILREHFNPGLNENVLDIGCGTGEFSVFFNPTNYTGIDTEKKYIEYALKKYKGRFLVADAANLPLEDHSFDKAMIIGLLHHMNDKECEMVLTEAKRVLKPGGHLLVMEDVHEEKTGFFARGIHSLDQGKYIRKSSEYATLLKKQFILTKNFYTKSGFCPYSVFLLNNHN